MVMRLMHNSLTPKPVTHTNNQPETWSALSAYYNPFHPTLLLPNITLVVLRVGVIGRGHCCCLEAAISLSNEHRFVNALQRLN